MRALHHDYPSIQGEAYDGHEALSTTPPPQPSVARATCVPALNAHTIVQGGGRSGAATNLARCGACLGAQVGLLGALASPLCGLAASRARAQW